MLSNKSISNTFDTVYVFQNNVSINAKCVAFVKIDTSKRCEGNCAIPII